MEERSGLQSSRISLGAPSSSGYSSDGTRLRGMRGGPAMIPMFLCRAAAAATQAGDKCSSGGKARRSRCEMRAASDCGAGGRRSGRAPVPLGVGPLVGDARSTNVAHEVVAERHDRDGGPPPHGLRQEGVPRGGRRVEVVREEAVVHRGAGGGLADRAGPRGWIHERDEHDGLQERPGVVCLRAGYARGTLGGSTRNWFFACSMSVHMLNLCCETEEDGRVSVLWPLGRLV